MRDIIRIILNNWEILLTAIVILLSLPFIAVHYSTSNTKLIGCKNTLKIFFTNWVNITLIFVTTYVAIVISALVSNEFSFIQAVFGAIYSVALYGLMFWIGFIVCILVLDIILFGFNKKIKYTTLKLSIEWLLISLPFIYWLIIYNEWVFSVAIFAFLIGQYLRRMYIIKALSIPIP